MPPRYCVVGFVTYGNDRGRRCAIPAGELVELSRAADGSGVMVWQDSTGRTWSEALSDRLLAHYMMSHLRLLPSKD